MSLPIPKNFVPSEALKAIRKASKAAQFYYTEERALQVKKILDTLHHPNADGLKEPLFIPAAGGTLNTLRTQWYQGKDYLLDNLDPDNHYKKLLALTEVKTRQDGLFFRALTKPKNKNTLTDFMVAIPDWRDKLELFLETASPRDKFFLDKLVLSQKDKDWINGQLAGLVKYVGDDPIPLFFGDITDTSILLIRDDN